MEMGGGPSVPGSATWLPRGGGAGAEEEGHFVPPSLHPPVQPEQRGGRPELFSLAQLLSRTGSFTGSGSDAEGLCSLIISSSSGGEEVKLGGQVKLNSPY